MSLFRVSLPPFSFILLRPPPSVISQSCGDALLTQTRKNNAPNNTDLCLRREKKNQIHQSVASGELSVTRIPISVFPKLNPNTHTLPNFLTPTPPNQREFRHLAVRRSAAAVKVSADFHVMTGSRNTWHCEIQKLAHSGETNCFVDAQPCRGGRNISLTSTACIRVHVRSFLKFLIELKQQNGIPVCLFQECLNGQIQISPDNGLTHQVLTSSGLNTQKIIKLYFPKIPYTVKSETMDHLICYIYSFYQIIFLG